MRSVTRTFDYNNQLEQKNQMKSFKAKAWMVPQPVLIIGTYAADGTPVAMNAAWGGTWSATEIIISLGSHATTDNLARCGEFTLSFATQSEEAAADFVGIVSARNVPGKVAKTGWVAEKAPNVNAPVFTNFPMTFECKLVEKLEESETGYCLVAKIVNILCDEKFLAEDGKPDITKMGLITFDPIHNSYVALGEKVGHAFADGKKFM